MLAPSLVGPVVRAQSDLSPHEVGEVEWPLPSVEWRLEAVAGAHRVFRLARATAERSP